MSKKNWTTWLTADPHIGHAKAIEFDDRPFKDIDEMEAVFIENWNKVVSPEDLGIFVGDMFFYQSKQQMADFLSKLNGRKVLVRGNHDQKPRAMMNAGFTICVEEIVMTIANERVLISHYPFAMPEWKHKYFVLRCKIQKLFGKKTRWIEKFHDRRPVDRGQFLIHGHTHSIEKIKGKMINVGWTAWDWKPVNIQEIATIISRIREQEKRNKK